MSVLLALVSPASVGWVRRAVRLLLPMSCLAIAWVSVSAADLPAVALHYGKNAPLASLEAFDIAVIEPDHGFDPQVYRRSGKSELFAYISVGEVHPTRAYAERIPEAWRIGRNAQWNSVVVDQAQSAWPAFLPTKWSGRCGREVFGVSFSTRWIPIILSMGSIMRRSSAA